jgi:hypothetical protein
MVEKEATRKKVPKEVLNLLLRHPRHPGALKKLGLDCLPDESVIVVRRNRIEILMPRKPDDSAERA